MPDAFTLGPVLLPTLRTAVVGALFVAILLSAVLAYLLGAERRWVRGTVDLSIVAGLLGARAAYVLMHWPAYAEQPWSALYVWQPGYAPLPGILTGAALALWRISGRRSERWRHTLPLLGGFAVAAIVVAGVYAGLRLPAGAGLALRPEAGPTLQSVLGGQTRARVAGSQVPTFQLQDLQGRPTTSASLAGRAVVLNFWATWCAPCRREIPLLDEMHRRYADAGATVLGVAVGESAEQVGTFLQAFDISYPVWLDPAQGTAAAELFERLGAVGFPTTFFIDREGVIRDVYVGELARAPLIVKLEALLAAGG